MCASLRRLPPSCDIGYSGSSRSGATAHRFAHKSQRYARGDAAEVSCSWRVTRSRSCPPRSASAKTTLALSVAVGIL